MKALRAVLLSCSLAAAVLGSAQAAEPGADPTSSKRWNYIVEPYLLGPNMSGTSGVRGLTSEVNVDPGDIFSALDFGAMLYLEMRGPMCELAPVLLTRF